MKRATARKMTDVSLSDKKGADWVREQSVDDTVVEMEKQ